MCIQRALIPPPYPTSVSSLKAWINALNGNMVQSYKPIVCLALFELADDKISKESFVDRVSEFFWQLETQFQLNHGPVNNEVHSKIQDCIEDSGKKEKWGNVKSQLDVIPKGGRRSRADFIWSKLCEMPLEKLPTSPNDNLYIVEQNHIRIPEASLRVIKANRNALNTFARCRLGEFLEKYNSSSPRINEKVKIAWGGGVRPSIRSYMREILGAYHNPLHCYLCEDAIVGIPDWDHVLPFSFIGGHDLWNLMPSCGPHSGNSKNCNQKKSNRMPSDSEIDSAEMRNTRMLEWLKDSSGNQLKKNSMNRGIRELEFEKDNGELRRLWKSMIG